MIRKLFDWHQERQARRLAITEFQWQAVETSLPFLGYLTADERHRLRELARQFIVAKQWSGAQGLQLSAEMQLAIALQACLPVLNLGLDWYAGWVGIVIYPGDFVIPRQFVDEDGIVHEFDDEVLGEAWDGGPVLLAWDTSPRAETSDELSAELVPVNVVIHEFAHKLDMAHGLADGMPPLRPDMSRRAWAYALQTAFADFNKRLDEDEPTRIDPYASSDPGEFFAVLSEVFFTAPAIVREEYPAVYQQFVAFYGQDPAATWPTA